MGVSPMKNGFHEKLAAHQADDITLFDVWGMSLKKMRWALEEGVASYGAQKRAR